ncbi:MAG: ribonuclease T [Pseudomonadales bacterium]|uniref:Ribonuclease T n=1 Tax=Oleiphilus messinensis TaxID=141451 RepID=A0A1Y0IBH8_9GAMM|nr:ribonuclease T [Oleiphilus messinensis]ARU57519.1 ribonuclease T [Oleiphilus messinensis]MCG8612445.1 ribonuclease T [Pseudomonadales bacterium]
MLDDHDKSPLAERFRGFLPAVIDVETGGFNPTTDALLEVAVVIIRMDEFGLLYPGESAFCNVEPFPGANMEKAALEFTGIDPHNPLRNAKPEREALAEVFRPVRRAVKELGCTRAILVGHNASFDQSFINAAVARSETKRNPFHPFSTFDTVSLSGLAFGQTVLAKACREAGIDFDNQEAHSAIYDAQKTAELFCEIVNKWSKLGGLKV